MSARRRLPLSLIALASTIAVVAVAFVLVLVSGGSPTSEPAPMPAMSGMSCAEMPQMAGCPASGMSAMPSSGIGDLQRMVDETPEGSTLTVPPGTYAARLVIDHPMVLDGMGAATIDAGGTGTVVTITAPDVTIRGVTLRASGEGPVGQPSGITIEEADRTLVQNVTIEDTYAGIVVRKATDVTIEGCTIQGWRAAQISGEMHVVGADETAGMDMGAANATTRGDGVSLWNTTGVTISDNRLLSVRDGVYVSFGTGIWIDGNLIRGSRYGIHTMYPQDFTATDNILDGNLNGIVLMYGGPSTVEGNTIEHSGSPSTGFGVLVKDAGSVTVVRNIMVDNRIGIHVDNGSATAGGPTLVQANTIALNQVGADVMSSARVSFTENSFVENVSQAILSGSGGSQDVHWTVEGRGNFWSSYQGYDEGGDGIGDAPYTETGHLDEMIDRAPVMTALVSGPGLRLFGSIADRWVPGEAAVTDSAPLTDAMSPTLHSAAGARPALPLWIPGLLVVLSCGFAVSRGRRPLRKDARCAV